jgi:hypothetical protein
MPATATKNLLEDTPTLQKPQVIMQVEKFLAKNTDPALFIGVIHKAFPMLLNTVWTASAVSMQVKAERRLIEVVTDKLDLAQQAYAIGDTRQVKPAELYRQYAPALRAVKENGAHDEIRMLAHEMLNELFLAQSLPAGELESPEWIDPYTGEPIEDNNVDWELDDLTTLLDRVEMASPLRDELYRRTLELKEELGWGQAEVDDFMRAQSGNDGWTLEPELSFDDRGYVPPTGDRSLEIDRTALALSSTAMAEFTRWRTETFEKMKKEGLQGMTWKAVFLDHKANSVEVASLIATIAEVADTYDIATAAAIALKAEGEYGLTEEDLDGVSGMTTNGVFYDLNDYIEEWGEDVLAVMNDSLGNGSPTSDIDKFDEQFYAELKALLPEKHHNPMQTYSFVVAYMEAIAAGATLGEAENSAIAAWRQAMNPAGARAYQDAWKNSRSKSVAWRAFWLKCGPDIPRPQEHVKAVRGSFSGLILASGRKIDWRIAAKKLENDEITWNPGQQEKLKALLLERGMKSNPVMKYL